MDNLTSKEKLLKEVYSKVKKVGKPKGLRFWKKAVKKANTKGE